MKSMMKYSRFGRLLPVVAVTVFLLINCGDDDGLGEDYEGITRTDFYGNVTSIDVDDWCGSLTPRYLYLEPGDCKILLPCGTPGDSVIDSFSVFNAWVYDIITTVTSSEVNLTVSPDSVIVPARDSVTFEVKFKLPKDSTYNGHITFTQYEPSISKQVYFSAGPEVEDITCAVGGVPSQYYLYPAYPNPAYTGALVKYALPRRSDVRITVYSPDEKLVAVLVDSTLDAGYHHAYWDVRAVNPDIYDCRMVAGDFECRGNIQVEL